MPRLATLPGAKLPAHLNPQHWKLLLADSTPAHSDADADIAAKATVFFGLSLEIDHSCGQTILKSCNWNIGAVSPSQSHSVIRIAGRLSK